MVRESFLRILTSGVPERFKRPKVALVIPAFNEESNIASVLVEVEALRRARPRWEIIPIVVNDGSTDRTAEVLDQLRARGQVRVVHLPLNLGIGRAVQTGFREATRLGADVTLQLDGDGQHPMGEVPLIVGPVLARTADVVVGSRYLKGAGGVVSSRFRRLGTGFFSLLLQLVTRTRISDPTSGFRAFSQEATEFLSRYYPDDYPEVEAYVPLLRCQFRVREVPVHMRPRTRGASSITALRAVYYMIKVAFATLMDVIRPIPRRLQRGPK
ncbi:MAG: glycosyltransferase family 2 protein [Bdellovibrionota bacterium]